MHSLLTVSAVTLLAAIGSCGGLPVTLPSVPFTYPKNGVPVKITDQTSVNQAIPIDLSTQAEIQAHKSNLQDLSLDSLDATVASVTSGGGAVINGNMKLRPEGGSADGANDVQVGTLTNVSVTTGTKVRLMGSPALDAALLSTIKGSGKATIVVVGTSSTPADFTLDLALHLSISYQP